MNSLVIGMGGAAEDVKKTIAIFTYKECVLSIDMETKVVQHKHLTYDMWQHDKQSLLSLHMKTKVVLYVKRITHVTHVYIQTFETLNSGFPA